MWQLRARRERRGQRHGAEAEVRFLLEARVELLLRAELHLEDDAEDVDEP